MTVQEKARDDYVKGAKYKEIAEKYGVSLNTVKSWKQRYNWIRKKSAYKNKKVCIQKKENEVQKALLETIDGAECLNEQQRLFCVHYATSHNALQSYLKVYKCSKTTAMTNGPALLRITQVKKEVQRLRKVMRQHLDIEREDLIQYCLKVVGADIGDYVSFKGSKVTLTDSTMVDTSIISEVKQGKVGVSIRLADKKWAWDKLEKYLGWDALTMDVKDENPDVYETEVDLPDNGRDDDAY